MFQTKEHCDPNNLKYYYEYDYTDGVYNYIDVYDDGSRPNKLYILSNIYNNIYNNNTFCEIEESKSKREECHLVHQLLSIIDKM
jgi:hypothetical protein